MPFAAIHEVIAGFFATPPLRAADISPRDLGHYVFSIISDGASCRIFAATAIANGVPAEIHSRPKGAKSRSWPTKTVYVGDDLAIYYVEMKTDSIPERSRFFCKTPDGFRRVFSAYSTRLVLPPEWRLSAYHLYLTYKLPEELERNRLRAFVRRIELVDGKLFVRGAIISSRTIDSATLTVRKFRDEHVNQSFDVNVRPARRIWGLNAAVHRKYRKELAYKFEAILDLDWQSWPNSLYSLMLQANDQVSGLFAFNSTFSRKNNLFDVGGTTIFAFIDQVASNVRLERHSFGRDAWREFEKLAASNDSQATPMLIGEYTNAARDNGIRLFEYAQSVGRHDCHYVVEKGTVPPGRQILDFGSSEHMRAAIQCSVVAFTHHSGYVYTHLAARFRASPPPKRFFLQHGITALKNSMGPYVFSKQSFDAFNVCSAREQEIVRRACKFPVDRIAICGFPRFDRLREIADSASFDDDTVLLFPTWRRGLDKVTPEEFEKSAFFTGWRSAIDAVMPVTQARGAALKLVAHPIIARHASSFAALGIELVSVEDIQELLSTSVLLVTDYSSIAFDAVYAGTPTIFYTFDAEEYGFREGAFIDVDTELPGLRVGTVAELVEEVTAALAAGRVLSERARAIVPTFFDHVDRANSERVLEKMDQLRDSWQAELAIER